METKNYFINIYNILIKHFGPQGWWPVMDSVKNTTCKYHPKDYNIPQTEQEKLQVILGAILAQNTSWKNVENALINLNKNRLIDLKKLQKISHNKLSRLIRPAGYFNQKAKKIKIFVDFLTNKYDCDINKFFSLSANTLRKELLALWGIGPETADSIILYGAKKPVFVIDSYTKRIFSRISLCKKDISYDELQELIIKKIKQDVNVYNEFHALLVEHAKIFCKKNPECGNCILSKICRKNI